MREIQIVTYKIFVSVVRKCVENDRKTAQFLWKMRPDCSKIKDVFESLEGREYV